MQNVFHTTIEEWFENGDREEGKSLGLRPVIRAKAGQKFVKPGTFHGATNFPLRYK